MDRRLAPPDAIVVLGCRGETDRANRALVRRAARAARAFHEHRCAAVIASGGRRWRGVSEAELLSHELRAFGVPAESIVRELFSLSTLENAWYSAELLRAGAFVSPAVVTCDWHMPRALECFDWVGVRAIGLCAFSPGRAPTTRLSDFVGERLKRSVDRRTAALWNGR